MIDPTMSEHDTLPQIPLVDEACAAVATAFEPPRLRSKNDLLWTAANARASGHALVLLDRLPTTFYRDLDEVREALERQAA